MTDPVIPYPLTTLHFEVTWGASTTSFSEVSGLTMEADAIDYRGGADKQLSVRKVPGLRKTGNVTLKRGIMPDATAKEMFEWYNSIRSGAVQRRTVQITLLNEARQPVITWTVRDAWPVKIEGPGLKGSGNEIAIESMELVNEGVEVG